MLPRRQITALHQRASRPQGSGRLGLHDEKRRCGLDGSSLLGLDHVTYFSKPSDRTSAFGLVCMMTDEDVVTSALHPDRRSRFGSARVMNANDVSRQQLIY
jgi:hypothetical protein